MLIPALFLAAVAVALILARRDLARAHGAILGGRTPAGCVIAEAVFLLLIAAAMVVFGRAG